MGNLGPAEWGLLIAFLLSLGGAAGFLAGLLGIGGGLVLVPGLYFGLKALGFESAALMHVAVGTSLAVIIPTGMSSARAHWKRGVVRLDLVRKLGGGVLLGVAGGTLVASRIDEHGMTLFFALALAALAVLMLLNPARFSPLQDVPRQPWIGLSGVGIGIFSSLMGIGGATISVPWMSMCRVPMHTAVGTASALGLVIAVPAAAGFILIGWGQEGLPPFSLGYINFLAWPLIIPASVLAAPWGARLAHSVSVERLRRFFAAFLVVIAGKMIWSACWHG
ncbi:MAG: sulfite exporter TauE/SafE family protein [Micavibrio aeruginosavorus]|uniref:Probable membrane transporter protein n=1 Tax=Micavibrio aeruginosavorus TaxID=349221 RepID=A0A7T5UH02_9BACT|nr:MAG: sulfite exporter TauE/SafE family protein [Micavibrio aeruginosavorus]